MRLLFAASRRFFRTHLMLCVATLGGVSLGVAAVVAIDIAVQSARTAMSLSVAQLNGETTHQIGGGPRGISHEVFADLRRQYPALPMAPVVEGRVRLNGEALSVRGVDLLAEAALRPNVLAVSVGQRDISIAEFLAEQATLVLAASTAERLAIAVGDRVQIAARQRRFEATVIALTDSVPDAVVLTDVANADVWLQRAGYIDRIDINASEYARVLDELATALPHALMLLPANAQSDATLGMTRAFTLNLQAMSLLALLIGVFLIFNAMSFSVVQRREQFAAVRAFGVERGQMLQWILAEAAALALVGSLIGLLVGTWLGTALTELVARTINDLYFQVRVTDITVSATIVTKALVLGGLFTLLATLPAALEVAATKPSLALRRSSLEPLAQNLSRRLFLLGIGTLVFAAGLAVFGGKSLVVGLFVLFLVIVGVAVQLPTWVDLALTHVLVPVARRIGQVTTLAVAGIQRSLSRTGVAIVALAIAMSATIGVSQMVTSFRHSVDAWLQTSLSADLYAMAPDGAMNTATVSAIRSLPGVGAVFETRRAWVSDASGAIRLQAQTTNPDGGNQQLLAGDQASAWQAMASGEAIIISEALAYQRDLGVGDSFRLPGTQEESVVSIAAIYRSYDVTGGGVLLSMSRYRALYQDSATDAIGLMLLPSVQTEAVVSALRSLPSDGTDLWVSDAKAIAKNSLAVFDRTFLVTDVLYIIAIGIAIVGIFGALMALQLEQARMLATYRALGMTRLQTGALVTQQAATIGLLAGLAAIPLGLVMARILIDVVNRRAFGWTMDFYLDPVVLGTAPVFAVLAAVAGGAWPAVHSARQPPALALRGAL